MPSRGMIFERRRALSVIEVMVSLFILATALAALVQLLAVTARQRRLMEQRRIALQEVANQAERLALANWDDLTAEKLAAWQPSPELMAALPRAQCTAAVTDDDTAPRSRRIDLRIVWPDAAGRQVEPVALTLWRYSPEARP